MRSLIKRLFDKFSKKNSDDNDNKIDILCNNPSEDLNNFCSLEYADLNRRSN